MKTEEIKFDIHITGISIKAIRRIMFELQRINDVKLKAYPLMQLYNAMKYIIDKRSDLKHTNIKDNINDIIELAKDNVYFSIDDLCTDDLEYSNYNAKRVIAFLKKYKITRRATKTELNGFFKGNVPPVERCFYTLHENYKENLEVLNFEQLELF